MSGYSDFQFRKYFQEPDFVEQTIAAGIEPTRAVNNDGSVIITAVGPDGERSGILIVRPIAPRKRSTPYDAPDPDRDALAQWIADTLNAALESSRPNIEKEPTE